MADLKPSDMVQVRSLIMEQRTLKNVNNYSNTNIYSYLETIVVKVLNYI